MRNLKFLQLLTRTVEPFIIDATEYLECAARIENNVPVIEYLLSLNCPVDQLKVLKSAVENKSLQNLKFFHQQMEFPIDNYNLFSTAAGTEDNILIMEYLKSHNCPTGHFQTSETAAENSALNNLKWLLKNGFSIKDTYIFYCAIKSGSLEIFKFLQENECPIHKRLVSFSLENCSIETIEWLIDQGIEIDPTKVFEGAARNGRLDKIEWLLEKKYSIEDPEIFEAAGSLENLEFLLKNGCSINDSRIFVTAARKGHFDIMKWLLKKKCPINDSDILVAAAEFEPWNGF